MTLSLVMGLLKLLIVVFFTTLIGGGIYLTATAPDKPPVTITAPTEKELEDEVVETVELPKGEVFLSYVINNNYEIILTRDTAGVIHRRNLNHYYGMSRDTRIVETK